jgi:hypothetical protein
VIAAYILIQAGSGKAAVVAAALRDLPGVVEAASVAGPYDVIARAQARDIAAEYRCRGLGQQRMLTAGGEIRIGQLQLGPHDAAPLDLGDGAARVSGPGRQGLADQLLQAAGHRDQGRLLQQGGHQQVTIAFQRFPLLGG